jgi:hypothetical protein
MKCPDCIKKSKGKWEPTIRQREALAMLGEQEGPTQMSISGAALGVLRKRGLVKQIMCWEITNKGRALLAECSDEQEEENV